jgi:parallel beta-helix repeat protein
MVIALLEERILRIRKIGLDHSVWALLVVAVFSVTLNVPVVRASGTIYIRSDGSIEPPTALIQRDGNVYTFTDNIYDSIVVERYNIVIDGNTHTLQGSGTGTGIYLNMTMCVTVRNTQVRNFGRGISLSCSSNNCISDNNITENNGIGIYLLRSSCNSLRGNNITASKSDGIYLIYSPNNSISDNNITKSNGDGIRLSESSNYNSISGNNIVENLYGIRLSGFYESSNNCISDNNITANDWDGIILSESPNNSISGNNITDNWYGMRINGSANNTISDNNIVDNGYGISLAGSSNNSISGNDITNNDWDGIWLYSSNNTLRGNSITANNEAGIRIGGSSNTISSNNITNNPTAGIMLYESSNNLIYHNNLIDNGQQVYDWSWYQPESVSPSINVWDDGLSSGGNYWDYYTGADANGDGIGDTPYVIDTNNQDRYPLMNRWTPPEHELVVTIKASDFVRLGGSSSLQAIVTNQGLDEVNVDLVLLINGTSLNSTTIHLLQADESYALNYLWTPTAEGTYNVTAYAPPLPEEASTENNQKTKIVTVAASPPLGAKVGVMAGDWIKLDYTITGAPSGALLPQWIKIEFPSVEGTTANLRVTMHMSDGTDPSQTMTVDVRTGGGIFQGLSGFFIPANCKTADSFYVSGYGNVTIAGETTRNSARASRAVVYANLSQLRSQLTYYWDKQTGVMVEVSTTSGGITGVAKATETNMWQAQPSGLPFDQTYLYVLVAAVIAVAVASIAFVMRRKKKPPEVRTPTAPTL